MAHHHVASFVFACVVHLLWSNEIAVAESISGHHHVEYISLHRALTVVPDLATAGSFCTSMYDQVSQLWVNRRGLGDEIKSRVNNLVGDDMPSKTSETKFGGQARAKFQGQSFLNRRKPKSSSLLKKTAFAATVATKTASKVATAALRSSTESTEENNSCGTIDFSRFNDVSVTTTLVSKNPRENSIMLASLKSKKKRDNKQELPPAKETSDEISDLLQYLVDPFIPQSVWNRLSGREFPENMALLDGLARTGYRIAANDESNEWIAWTKVAPSFRETLEESGIHVWTGRARVNGKNDRSFYGAAAPIIKSRSIVPMSPMELVELMLDSNRVKTYNKYSVGRQDLWKSSDERTKIVQNTNSIPVGSKKLRSTTLLHACPVDGRITETHSAKTGEDASWLLLSRAIGPQPEDKTIGTSDILLGVNLIQPLGDGQSSLTAVTHVYSDSAAIPGVIAEKMGVKSAINFVKDLRGLVVPASS